MITDYYEYNLFKASNWGDDREVKRCQKVMNSVQMFIKRSISNNESLPFPENCSEFAKNPLSSITLQQEVLDTTFEPGSKSSKEYIEWLSVVKKYSSAVSFNYLKELLEVETSLEPDDRVSGSKREKKAYISGIEKRLDQVTSAIKKLKPSATPAVAKNFMYDPYAKTFRRTQTSLLDSSL